MSLNMSRDVLKDPQMHMPGVFGSLHCFRDEHYHRKGWAVWRDSQGFLRVARLENFDGMTIATIEAANDMLGEIRVPVAALLLSRDARDWPAYRGHGELFRLYVEALGWRVDKTRNSVRYNDAKDAYAKALARKLTAGDEGKILQLFEGDAIPTPEEAINIFSPPWRAEQ